MVPFQSIEVAKRVGEVVLGRCPLLRKLFTGVDRERLAVGVDGLAKQRSRLCSFHPRRLVVKIIIDGYVRKNSLIHRERDRLGSSFREARAFYSLAVLMVVLIFSGISSASGGNGTAAVVEIFRRINDSANHLDGDTLQVSVARTIPAGVCELLARQFPRALLAKRAESESGCQGKDIGGIRGRVENNLR